MPALESDDDKDSELERAADEMLAEILPTEAHRDIICRLFVRQRSGDIGAQDVDATLAIMYPNEDNRSLVRSLLARWRSVYMDEGANTGSHGSVALFSALEAGNGDCASLLVQLGVDVNSSNAAQSTGALRKRNP